MCDSVCTFQLVQVVNLANKCIITCTAPLVIVLSRTNARSMRWRKPVLPFLRRASLAGVDEGEASPEAASVNISALADGVIHSGALPSS